MKKFVTIAVAIAVAAFTAFAAYAAPREIIAAHEARTEYAEMLEEVRNLNEVYAEIAKLADAPQKRAVNVSIDELRNEAAIMRDMIETAVKRAESAKIRVLDGVVTDIDETSWVMTIETCDGNVWLADVNDEWNVGDKVSITFETNCTENITDDRIIDIDYVG